MQPNLRSFFSSMGTHPLALDVCLANALGPGEDGAPAYASWDPAALWQVIVQEAAVPNISNNVKQKVMALCLVRSTERAYKEWPIFEKVIAAFNDVPVDFEMMQKPDLGQLMVGVGIMRGIKDHPFSEEVQKYIAACLLTDSLVYAPAPLSFVNHEMIHASPVRLHEKVAVAVRDGLAGADEATTAQLAKLQEAKAYSDAASERLLESLKVVDHAPALRFHA